MLALRNLLVGAALVTLAAAQQAAFNLATGPTRGASTRGSSGFPAANLTVSPRPLASVASRDEFVALAHPRFPAHQVRVKKSDFCDPTVK